MYIYIVKSKRVVVWTKKTFYESREQMVTFLNSYSVSIFKAGNCHSDSLAQFLDWHSLEWGGRETWSMLSFIFIVDNLSHNSIMPKGYHWWHLICLEIIANKIYACLHFQVDSILRDSIPRDSILRGCQDKLTTCKYKSIIFPFALFFIVLLFSQILI